MGISADEAKARGMEAVTKKYIMSAKRQVHSVPAGEGIYKGGGGQRSHRILGADDVCQGHGYDQPVCGGYGQRADAGGYG